MTLRLRRYLFLAFVGFFLIAAPLIVGFTAGYRLNFTNRKVLQTGAVAVSSFPKGAIVTLNGNESNQKTPTVIQRIAEGQAEIVIEKSGFHPWNRQIAVPSGGTIYVTASLFADETPVAVTGDERLIVRAQASLKRQAAVLPPDIKLTQTSSGIEITKTSLLGNESETLALLPVSNYDLLIADRNYLIFRSPEQKLFLVNRDQNDVVTFAESATAFDWNGANKLLLWTDGYEIHVYNADEHSKTLITRQSEPIIAVNWDKNLEAIIYSTKHKVIAVDKGDYLNGRFSVELFKSTENITDGWTDPRGETYYFENGNQLFALPL